LDLGISHHRALLAHYLYLLQLQIFHLVLIAYSILMLATDRLH